MSFISMVLLHYLSYLSKPNQPIPVYLNIFCYRIKNLNQNAKERKGKEGKKLEKHRHGARSM